MANPSMPISAGSEHLFTWNLEGVTGKHVIHGEAVALGILICSHLQKRDHRELREAIETACIIYHPEEMGIEWHEVEETLLSVNDYNWRVRKFNTVFDEVMWTPHLFEELRELIYVQEGKAPS